MGRPKKKAKSTKVTTYKQLASSANLEIVYHTPMDKDNEAEALLENDRVTIHILWGNHNDGLASGQIKIGNKYKGFETEGYHDTVQSIYNYLVRKSLISEQKAG